MKPASHEALDAEQKKVQSQLFREMRVGCAEAGRAGGCLNPFGVIGANMGCKLFVALQLEVAHHFVERCASGLTRGFEPPATFGTPKTPKTLWFNPHQFPPHGGLCRCAPTLSDHMPSTRLPIR